MHVDSPPACIYYQLFINNYHVVKCIVVCVWKVNFCALKFGLGGSFQLLRVINIMYKSVKLAMLCVLHDKACINDIDKLSHCPAGLHHSVMDNQINASLLTGERL